MTDASQTSSGPEIGTVIAEKYRIIRHIGAGGMGVVLEAEHTRTGKRVAIKCLHPGDAAHQQARQRFMLEARASARIRHPNVVDVYDVLEEPDNAFMVMELLDGESLGSLMARRRLEPRRFISLLLGAMRGVSAAHKQRVIHRDIKPDNIFLARQADQRGRTPIVLDFGLSKLLDVPERLALTRSGIVMGTLLYMSPEQLEGVPTIDARTDIYAFGVILYEGLAGRMPFEAETARELMAQILNVGAPPLREFARGIPPGVEDIVARAMAAERAERTPSLDALIGEIEPYVSRATFRAPPPKRSETRAVRHAQPSPPASQHTAAVGTLIRASFRTCWFGALGVFWIVVGILQYLTRNEHTGETRVFGDTRVDDKLAQAFEGWSDAFQDAVSVALELVAVAVIGAARYAARTARAVAAWWSARGRSALARFTAGHGAKLPYVSVAIVALLALAFFKSRQIETATVDPAAHVVVPADPVQPEPAPLPLEAAPATEQDMSPLAYPMVQQSTPVVTPVEEPPPAEQRTNVNVTSEPRSTPPDATTPRSRAHNHRARLMRRAPPAPESTPPEP